MWWNLPWNIAAASLEAQQVITLRLMKMARGGPGAQEEAHKMVSEKMVAAVEAATALAGGTSLDVILKRYRTIMRANSRRLSKSRS